MPDGGTENPGLNVERNTRFTAFDGPAQEAFPRIDIITVSNIIVIHS